MVGLWEDGQARLRDTHGRERQLLERIVDELVLALRRRLGGKFTLNELAEEYMRGTDWCFDVALQAAPADPGAWDLTTVVGAAFARFMRQASDFGGGRKYYQE